MRVEKGSGKKEVVVKSPGKASCARPHALFFIVCLVFLVCAGSARGLDVPPLKGYVNDYANMMSQETRAQLERELKDFEQSDSTQVVILTVESIEGDVLESFSIRVAEKWKIGQKGKDNGVILLAVKKERKTRIEVGRGLEGQLTDLTAGRIVQLVINPQFKRGDFNAGFTSGIRAVIDATRGEFKADKVRRSSSTKGNRFVVHAAYRFRRHRPSCSGQDIPLPRRRRGIDRFSPCRLDPRTAPGGDHFPWCSRSGPGYIPSPFLRRALRGSRRVRNGRRFWRFRQRRI